MNMKIQLLQFVVIKHLVAAGFLNDDLVPAGISKLIIGGNYYGLFKFKF